MCHESKPGTAQRRRSRYGKGRMFCDAHVCINASLPKNRKLGRVHSLPAIRNGARIASGKEELMVYLKERKAWPANGALSRETGVTWTTRARCARVFRFSSAYIKDKRPGYRHDQDAQVQPRRRCSRYARPSYQACGISIPSRLPRRESHHRRNL
jgi:hypothetical protein